MAAERLRNALARENDELMYISSTEGRLLRVGDELPVLNGNHKDPYSDAYDYVYVNGIKGVKVISMLNKHETEICDIQTEWMEQFAKDHPDITVVSVSKQSVAELARIAREKGLTHKLLSIDSKTAEYFSAELRPANDSASSEWSHMPLRQIIVADGANMMMFIERDKNLDQAAMPNLVMVGQIATALDRYELGKF